VANTVMIRITTNEAQAVAGMEKVKASGMGLGGVMKMAGAGMVLGLGAAAVASVKLASEFQATMERLHTQAGVGQDQIKGLGDQVLKLSGQVAQDPNSLADALYHIESSFASTGITGQKAMELLKVASQGATMGGANLVDVTNALDAAVVSGIPGVENLNQAMGVLNATVGAGDMNMQDLANAFSTGMVATVKGFGLSIKDVGAALALLGDNNMRGQLAANNFRMAVQAMAMPVANSTGALKALGLTTTTLAEDMQKGGLNAAVKDLHDRLIQTGNDGNKMGEILTQAFGRKAGTALNIMLSQYDRLQSKYVDLTKGANTFADAWAQTTKTFQFQISAFVDGAKAAGISLGEALLPAIASVIGILKTGFPLIEGIAHAFLSIPDPVRNAALALGAFALASRLLGPVIGQIGTKLKETGTSFTGWASGIKNAEGMSAKFKAGLGNVVGALGGPWGLAITGGITLLGIWASRQAAAKQQVDDFRTALEASGGAITNDMRAKIADKFATDGTTEAARKLGVSLKDVTSASLGDTAARARVIDSLKKQGDAYQMVTTMGTMRNHAMTSEASAINTVLQAMGAQNDALNKSKQQSQDYAAAMGTATAGTDKMAAASAALKQAQDDLTTALDGTKNATLGLMGSEDAYYGALQGVTDAVKQNGKSFNVTTKAGLANRQALEQLGKTGLDYVATLQKQGASEDVIHAKLAMVEKSFISAARQMGYSKTAAAALADQIFGDATAADTAARAADRLRTSLSRLPSSKQVTVRVTTQYVQVGQPGMSTGGKALFETGGVVGGAATGGPRGGWTLVGERGPELLPLPAGTMVRSHSDTQQMLASGHGQPEKIVLELRSSGSAVDEMMLRLMRQIIRVRGGNVQTVLGAA
jgi:TP901 family phage tail tape measure protein